MDAREMVEKDTIYDQTGKKAKLLHHMTIIRVCLVMLMLTFISSCGGGYYKDSQGRRVNTQAAKHHNQGNDYAREGDYARAISEYTKALEIEPGARIYVHRGYAYGMKGQHDQALSDANKAIVLDSNYADGYLLKGAACEELKRNKEAIEAYKNYILYIQFSEDASNIEEVKKRIDELEKQQ